MSARHISARSAFFRATFQAPFRESANNSVELSTHSLVLHDVLHFIYVTDVPIIRNLLNEIVSLDPPTTDGLKTDLCQVVNLAVAADFLSIPRIQQIAAEAVDTVFKGL